MNPLDDTHAAHSPRRWRRAFTTPLSIAVLVAIGWECFAAISHRERYRSEWRERLNGTADEEQRLIEDWLAQGGELARLAARQPWARDLADRGSSPETVRSALDFAREELPLWEIAVFDGAKRLVADAPSGSASGLPSVLLVPRDRLVADELRAAIVPAAGHDRARVSLAVPIHDSQAASLVLSQDPALFFASMLGRSRTTLGSRESLLAERVGTQIRILTPLHSPDVAVAAESPGEDGLRLSAAVAAERVATYGRFLDYRHQVVLAAIRPIVKTTWGLVVKVDEREVFAAWREEVAGRALRTFLLLSVVAALMWNERQSARLRAVILASRRDARYRLLIGSAHDAVLVARATDGRIVEANDAAERLYGYSGDEFRSLGLLDLRSASSSTDIQVRLNEAAAGEHYESRHRRKDGSEVFVEVSGGRLAGDDEPLILAIVRDVTRRKTAEERVARLDRLIRTIAEISQSIAHERDPDLLLQSACESLVEGARFPLAWIGRGGHGCGTLEAVAAAGDSDDYIATTGDSSERTTPSSEPATKALALSRSVVEAVDSPAPANEAWREAARRRGARWVIAVPFATARDERYVLAVCDDQTERFDTDQRRLLERLAAHLAVTLDARASDRALLASEAQLRKSQERLNLAIASTGIGLWELDLLTGRVEYARDWMAVLGYDESDDLGNSVDELERLMLPEDRVRAHLASAPYFERPNGLLQSEVRMRHKDGTYRWILACGSAVEKTPDGRATRLIGYNIDITERKRAEEELQAAYERFHMVSRATHDIVWDWNLESDTVWWSSGLETLLGFDTKGSSASRATSVRWWHENIHPEDLQRALEGQELALRNAEPLFTAQYRFRTAAGDYLEMEDRGYFVRNAEGRAIRAVGAMVDVTARRRAEREVLRVNEELEQRVLERTNLLATANRELEAFAYSVSHDLRAPLRAISGFSSILDEQHSAALDSEGKRLLGVVRRNASRMGFLIDDLLALSRASRQELRRNEVDMAALFGSVWAELDLGQGGDIELVASPLPAVHGDVSMLRQVWSNLLANAIKFGAPYEHRRIEVDGRSDAGGVTYSVRDNGVGFDMAYADKLFGLFQRLHGREEFEGTGVGLALVHRIVQRHGGRVWCESAIGKGATFHFWLPAAGSGPRASQTGD